MSPDETKTYIERRLREVGWDVRIPKAGYEQILMYTAGQEDRLNHLYYKLVSIGSQQPKREVNDEVVTLAINELTKMDELLERAGIKPGRTENIDTDVQSIEHLAAALEEKMTNEPVINRKEKRNSNPSGGQMAAAKEKKAAPAANRLPKMLVVDDSATIRAVVAKALSEDFSLVEATDGEQAWKILKQDPDIEIVVTDLMMPNLDGYGLIDRVRADQSSPRFGNMPIIVVTALADANSKLKALVAGANDFITKNTDALEMQARVVARYKLAQTTAGHAQHRHAASQPAAGHARPNNNTAPATNSPAPARAAAPAVRPVPDVGRNAPPRQSETRAAVRPIAQLRSAPAADSKLDDARHAWKAAREKLAELGPTTLITLGATALFVVVVTVIFYVNRVAPKPGAAPTQIAQSDGAASAADPAAEQSPSPASDARPAVGTEPKKPAEATPRPAEVKAKPKPVPAPTPVVAAAPVASTAPTAPIAAAAPKVEAKPREAQPAPVVVEPVAIVAPREPTTSAPVATAPVVETAVVPVEQVAAAPRVAPNRIAQAELANLLRKFAFVYEAGDIEQFMSLFDDDVRTNDRATKAGLREDYESLFQNSVNRQMLLGNISWEINERQASGFGNFEVRIRRANDEEVKTYRGSLTLHVEKSDGRIRIKRMYHGQHRAGG